MRLLFDAAQPKSLLIILSSVLPEMATPVPHFPGNTLERMINNDFGWAASNRSRILGKWQKRYDAKSEPKG
jgi:iron(III) transport system substrate-binding protein